MTPSGVAEPNGMLSGVPNPCLTRPKRLLIWPSHRNHHDKSPRLNCFRYGNAPCCQTCFSIERRPLKERDFPCDAAKPAVSDHPVLRRTKNRLTTAGRDPAARDPKRTILIATRNADSDARAGPRQVRHGLHPGNSGCRSLRRLMGSPWRAPWMKIDAAGSRPQLGGRPRHPVLARLGSEDFVKRRKSADTVPDRGDVRVECGHSLLEPASRGAPGWRREPDRHLMVLTRARFTKDKQIALRSTGYRTMAATANHDLAIAIGYGPPPKDARDGCCGALWCMVLAYAQRLEVRSFQ